MECVCLGDKARKRSNVENMANEEEKAFSGREKIKILWIIGSDDLENTWRKHHPDEIFDLLSVYPYNYRSKSAQNRPSDSKPPNAA
jgi:head-tail adaptor